MLVRARNCLLNPSAKIIKNTTRQCTAVAASNSNNDENTVYPTIYDVSPRGRKRLEKQAWHDKIKILDTVEEKLFAINMPKYYGWKSLQLHENKVHYNSLDFIRYITRTHVVEELPDAYNKLIPPEKLSGVVEQVKTQIEDAITFEHAYALFKPKPAEESPRGIREAREMQINSIIYQINRIMLTEFSSKYPHLLETDVDLNPRLEAFWFARGVHKPDTKKEAERKANANKAKNNTKKEKKEESVVIGDTTELSETDEIPEEHVEVEELTEDGAVLRDPPDIPIQYYGCPIIQLRHSHPLKELMSINDSENSDFRIPSFKYDPRVLGYCVKEKHATTVPGFWPGDPSEFGLLSYHSRGYMKNRPEYYQQFELEALTVQAILASYSWLLTQSCYQGFSTFHDLTYPLVTQAVITDGQWWSFCVYQLNTLLVHSEHAITNPRRNMCWITKPQKLYDTFENGKVHGFNEEALQSLVKFYANMPKQRTNIDMKPYLGESVKVVADIPDDERRAWLDKYYKHLVSNRPRHRKRPEIPAWYNIFVLSNRTNLIKVKKEERLIAEAKTSKRRLNDHTPRYVPKCLRANPKKKKVGRWEKTYYPDA